jgi:exonuclease SbcC
MKIKNIKIKNFIGVKEFNYDADPKLNILKGKTGSGKTSVLEGIEKAFNNTGRRTELISHGENEATLFIETDDGLEIERKLRNDKSDYFKLRKQGEGIKSTESELRKFIKGDVFRPLDFINLTAKEQTNIILSMIKMNYSAEEIVKWFLDDKDVLSGINTDKHMLQVLKDVENKFYKEREEVNRDIKNLDIQVKNIERGLPDNYNGNEWKDKKIQEYYNKVSDAERVNKFITEAKNLKENFDNKVNSIKADEEAKKARLDVKYSELKQDLKDLIELSKQKIEKENSKIEGLGTLLENQLKDYDNQLEKDIARLKANYIELKETAKRETTKAEQQSKEEIKQQQQKIAVKEQEISTLDEKKELEKESIEKNTLQLIELEKQRIGKASEYLENNEEIDIEPLKIEAEKVVEMQGYLRDWDRMLFIRDGELATKKGHADYLTRLITIAREKPSELLKIHELPLDGISVDENGLIRINGTLLDGLSDGEKLDAAFKIALQRMGELRVMCLDGFQNLDEDMQKKVIEICESNDIQTFMTVTKYQDTEGFEIENKFGEEI